MNSSPLYPLATVGGLIYNKEKILLIKSHKWSNLYCVPGGKIDYGETMEVAFKREIKEETQLDIYNIKFVCIQDCIEHQEFYKKKHFLLINFTADTLEHKVVLNEEAQEYIWVDIKESLHLPLNEPTKFLINSVLSESTSIN